MAGPLSHVVLVSTGDQTWRHSCEKALRRVGIDSVEAHNCWSAEVAQRLHHAEAIVIDGEIVCGSVSAERPGPVLVQAPKLPVVIFNAQELNEEQRSAARAHQALMVEGHQIAEIASRLKAALHSS